MQALTGFGAVLLAVLAADAAADDAYIWTDPTTGRQEVTSRPPPNGIPYRVHSNTPISRAEECAMRRQAARNADEDPCGDNRGRRVYNRDRSWTPAVGMSADDLRRKWGEPRSVNHSVSASGDREQWIYEQVSDRLPSDYVYVERERVVYVQMSR